MKPMRYAHSEGHTDLCFEDSGRYILTCGTDGDVRIWEGIDDDDAVSHRVGDRVFAIAFKNGRFFTATDANSVQANKFPDGSPDGIITRFTAPVSHMAFSSSGTTMVAGASDFTVKVVDVESSSHKVFRGHKAPILSITLDPKEQFVASSSCDGTVRVWKMDDQTEVKVMNIPGKCSDVSLASSLCRLCWTSGGEYLLVPVDKEIHVYTRDTWDLVSKITHPDISGAVNVLTLCPNGRHMAAGCVGGTIAIIDWQLQNVVEKHKHEKGFTITALAWNPSNKHQMAFCDKEGQLGVLDDVFLSVSNDNTMTGEAAMEGVFDDDDDMLIQASAAAMTNDDDVNDDDDTDSIDLGAIKKRLMPAIMGDEDSNAADSVTEGKGEGEGEVVPSRPVVQVVEGFKPTPLQKPFQPGSTPEHLTSRFMKWNSVGIVRQYNTEEENSIDIEFHDTATHHAMHITNNADYTMADVSMEAVVLATASDEESNSKLMCMHFGSWDNAKEWSVAMPEGETIQTVVLGEGWVAVATSMRNIRLFSVGGVQRQLFSLPGPVVCLAAHGRRLLVVYHAGMGIPGDQSLCCRILTVTSQKRPCEETLLPLSPKSTLSWIGFSAEGTPFFMDSEGIVRMKNFALGGTWTEVADTRENIKGKSDHYWIVGVSENPQQLRCIPCKGSRYPATLPRPAVTVLPFRLPLCESSLEKSQYEEEYLRSNLFAQHLTRWAREGMEVDETTQADLLRPQQTALMKLFALSARSEREFRAMEVCDLMPDEHTLQLSIKYATRLKHMQLATRISQLVHQRQQEAGNEEEEEEEEDFREYLNARHNTLETEWTGQPSNGHGARQESEGEEEADREEEEGEDRTSTGPMLNVKPKDKKSKQPSFSRNNPFKVSQSKDAGGSTKGTQVFDSMKKVKEQRNSAPVISPLPVSIRQTKTGQRKIAVKGKQTQAKITLSGQTENGLDSQQTASQNEEPSENEPAKKPASAFELWMSEHQEELAEEHPDVSQEELNRLAAEKFRTLSREDRQVWIQKAKSQTQAPNTAAKVEGSDSDKKRKRTEDTEETEATSKKLQKTTSKSEPKKPLSQSTNAKLANFAFSSSKS